MLENLSNNDKFTKLGCFRVSILLYNPTYLGILTKANVGSFISIVIANINSHHILHNM